ncbi:DUF262 domain-containing protein [Bradyrhizobium sp. Leo170]|uniref:DUF262 domain-containing protein n=1 Tax=Bradyrhizobium sp. Leo170 TaxID=1571199 RepID=UPI00102E45FC|nr:DUF262 domain-containing protein [Bradyrhizobium sp. Leo170]TAI62077.1 hypothetical protein CWO89_31715 [Bradyrhizobium sp. Leo170]
MAESLNIRKIIEELSAGRMRVPNFQRGFVWDPERVAYLMDSIYKSYCKRMGDDIEDIEEANFLPASTWEDNFEKFVEDRSVLLGTYTAQLLNGGTVPKKKKGA